jgi:hypothetical protein
MLKEKLEAFYERNSKPINITLLVILPLIGGTVGATLGYQAKGIFGALANFVIGWLFVYFSYLACIPITLFYGILFSKEEPFSSYRAILGYAIFIFIVYWVYKFFSIYSL